MGRTQWLILAVCFGIMVADGFDTGAMAFVAPALGVDLAVPVAALGPVLSAALLGLATGALLAGPLADHFGRRTVLFVSVLTFSIWTLATTQAGTVPALIACRFLTGVGIGAAMPNCSTLVAEFTPSKRRSFLGNLMFVGFPLGASLGGFLSAGLIPRYGWRSIFLVGGGVPVLLAGLLFLLPESISFMVVRNWSRTRIQATLARIAGHNREALQEVQTATSFSVPETSASPNASPLALLLSPAYRFTSITLGATYFLGLLLYYMLTSWMPTLIRAAGHSIGDAARIAALFPLGGVVGAIVCGWLMDRIHSTKVVAAAYLLTAALLLVLSRFTGTMGPFMALTLLAGMAMNGAQTSMPALAAASYPTRSRASGVAWMLGVGRFGGVTGALGGGLLIGAGFHLPAILVGLAVVSALAATALALKARGSAATANAPA